MSRSPAKSGKATATKSLKEKWLSIVQSATEKGEKGIGGPSIVTTGTEHLVTIITDHKNLGYFKQPQNLSRRQARWWLFLQEYDIRWGVE